MSTRPDMRYHYGLVLADDAVTGWRTRADPFDPTAVFQALLAGRQRTAG